MKEVKEEAERERGGQFCVNWKRVRSVNVQSQLCWLELNFLSATQI